MCVIADPGMWSWDEDTMTLEESRDMVSRRLAVLEVRRQRTEDMCLALTLEILQQEFPDVSIEELKAVARDLEQDALSLV